MVRRVLVVTRSPTCTRNISYDPALWRDYAKIVKLDRLFLQLGVQRIELGTRRIESGFCLIEILLAHYLSRIQTAGALVLLFGILQVG